MRKALSAILLLILPSLLFADMFVSNELGQRLEALQSMTDSGFVLVEDGTVRALYCDGAMLWDERRLQSGEAEYTVVRVDSRTGAVLTRTYKDGRLTLEVSSDRDGESRTSYAYIDGRLALTTTVDQAGIQSVSSYLRTADKNRIIGVSQSGDVRFLSDDFIVQRGDVLQNLASNLVVSGDHEVLEDGTIRVEDDGRSLYYSVDGRLLRSVSDEETVSYHYDSDVLSSITTVLGTKRTVENYRDGAAFEIYVYIDGELESHTLYKKDGNITALYSNGRKVAVIHYKKDNRTIDRIEYN